MLQSTGQCALTRAPNSGWLQVEASLPPQTSSSSGSPLQNVLVPVVVAVDVAELEADVVAELVAVLVPVVVAVDVAVGSEMQSPHSSGQSFCTPSRTDVIGCLHNSLSYLYAIWSCNHVGIRISITEKDTH